MLHSQASFVLVYALLSDLVYLAVHGGHHFTLVVLQTMVQHGFDFDFASPRGHAPIKLRVRFLVSLLRMTLVAVLFGCDCASYSLCVCVCVCVRF